jgi:UDP-N-acetylmuramate dehydrogenase
MRTPFARVKGIVVRTQIPLARYTSFRIGGKVPYFVRVYSKRALLKVLGIIKKRDMRYFIIGAGTNLLVYDEGYDGVVLKLDGIFKKMRRNGNIFVCGAAVACETFVSAAATAARSGAEFLCGIPGTVGGGLKGNAGAFGKSFSDIVKTVNVIDRDLEEKTIDRDRITFAYRNSGIQNGTVITGVEIELSRGNRERILRDMQRNKKHRWKRQPVEASAGSFFKNPVPLSAGKLIEQCGLKGLTVGNAQVSRKHANFIVNLGNAKARDIVQLAGIVQKVVREKTGVKLKKEVRILK